MTEKKKRVVIKLGSSTVADAKGRLDRKNMRVLVDQVVAERRLGHECLIVSSGAIAAGIEKLNLDERPSEISKLQAAAAVGQGLLIQEYTTIFQDHDMHVAQILLTQFDMGHRELYLNARQAINQIIDMGAIPIVNENDTTAVEEIKFGDNDTIAALVAVLVEADLLIILSDVEGLYHEDPRQGSRAELISKVDALTPEIEAKAVGQGGKLGSGGMITKLNAARITSAAKIGMYIADGRADNIVRRLMNGEVVGTFFAPKKRKVPGRKLWIGFGRMVCGRVVIDQGAQNALVNDGRSLLPAGVVNLDGDFVIGDTIEVVGKDGKAIARGLSNYAASELRAVRGKRTDQITEQFGGDFSEEVIHRDFMVIL